MTPDRPALARVRAVFDGTDDPADAFERLTTAGVLPLSWTGDPTRAFWCRGCAGHGRLIPTPDFAGGECSWCRGNPSLPSRIEDLVAWASLGVLAIERAEEFAREAVARLAPWGVARGPHRRGRTLRRWAQADVA